MTEDDEYVLARLTPAQERILDYIEDCVEGMGRPPTRVEIAEKFGFRSTNAADQHLRLLAKKGRIKLVPGKHRGIQLVAP